MKAPIFNANTLLLNQNSGTLPNMRDTLSNYFQQTTFINIVKSVVNGQVVETQTPYCVLAIVEVMSGQQLMIKPEGQRQWRWISVWAYPDLFLNTDDIVQYLGVNYRVDHKNDWSVYGYLQYDLVEDYKA